MSKIVEEEKEDNGIIIHQLKIVFLSNQPDKEEKEQEFTSSMFLQEDIPEDVKTGEHPYFTNSVEYPYKLLRTMKYSKLIAFFFNKTEFMNVLKNYHRVTPSKERITGRNNINMMLKFLFPTWFPIAGNTIQSTDFLTGNSGGEMIYDFTRHFTKEGRYSCLKLDGKEHTVSRVVWLNDVFNHPKYMELINRYKSLYNHIVEIKEKTKGDDCKDDSDKRTNPKCIKRFFYENVFNEFYDTNGKIRDDTVNTFVNFVRNNFVANTRETENPLLQRCFDVFNKKIQDFKELEDLIEFMKDTPFSNFIMNWENLSNKEKIDIIYNCLNEDTVVNTEIIQGKDYKLNDLNNILINDFINKYTNKNNKDKYDKNDYEQYQKYFEKYKTQIIEYEDQQDNKKYYSVFYKIMQQYVRFYNEKSTNFGFLDEDKLKGYNTIKKISYVGVNNINISDTNKPKREIYLRLDFFSGNLRNTPIHHCNFSSNLLGDKFIKLWGNVNNLSFLVYPEPFYTIETQPQKQGHYNKGIQYQNNNKNKEKEYNNQNPINENIDNRRREPEGRDRQNEMDKKGEDLIRYFKEDKLQLGVFTNEPLVNEIKKLKKTPNYNGDDKKYILNNVNELYDYIFKNKDDNEIKIKITQLNSIKINYNTKDIVDILSYLYKYRDILEKTGNDTNNKKQDIINKILPIIGSFTVYIQQIESSIKTYKQYSGFDSIKEEEIEYNIQVKKVFISLLNMIKDKMDIHKKEEVKKGGTRRKKNKRRYNKKRRTIKYRENI